MGKIGKVVAAVGTWVGVFVASQGNIALATMAGSAVLGALVGRRPMPRFKGSSSSAPSRANQMEENSVVPLIYGRVCTSGFIIRTGLSSVHVAFCKGVIEDFQNISCNGVALADLESVPTSSEFYGTASQSADSRFTPAYRYPGIAYIGLTFSVTFDVSGGIPNITALVLGKKCRPLANLTSGTLAYTRNNAVILADFLINEGGVTVAEIDTTSFQALETYCDAIPNNNTVRYMFDYSFSSKTSFSEALKIIENS